jgi:hypothetical protein
MKTKLILSVIWTISCFVPKSQASDKFKLRVNNNSDYTTICTIAGNDKVDSVLPHREKTILFQLEKDQPSFYLDLSSVDQSPNSYKYTRIRILNEESSKNVNITSGNRLEYSLNPAEKIIAAYNPQPRTRNFWKLDSVINKNADNIAGGEIIFLCLCDIDVKLDTIRKYYNFLTPSVKSSAYGKRITNYIEARNRLNAGNKMIDIELADTTGSLVRLGKIKSDYILLDFWFSRCHPCIQSFPALQELYEKD